MQIFQSLFYSFLATIYCGFRFSITMFPFLCGFATGVYVGTYYDCKPTIEYITIKIKENLPKDIPKPKPTPTDSPTGRGKDE